MYHLRAWWNKYEQRLAAWTGFVGFFALVIGWLTPELLPSTLRECIFAGGLAFVFIGGAATFLVMSVRLHRRARYAEAIVTLRDALRKIAEEDVSEFHTSEEKRKALASAVDDVSATFSILSGSSCRCCIKRVNVAEGQLMVGALSRNSDYREQDELHPVEHNTAFRDLYQDKKKRWFFGNNLPELAKKGEYSNTNKNWMKLYRSTIVWPIRRCDGAHAEHPELIGFLCVDSRRSRPFSEEYDYPIGAMVADVLYPFLVRLANSSPGPSVVAGQSKNVPANQIEASTGGKL
jgi:hypothetical protein